MTVHLTNRQRRFPVDKNALSESAQACLTALGIAAAELSILLVNDRAMRTLNRDHRGIDKATDVLSFPLFDGSPATVRESLEAMQEQFPEDAALGDVVVSLETAQRQALENQVSVSGELTLLLVHGILHLMGYDHELGADQAREMGVQERRLLTALGATETGLIERGNL